MFRYTNAIEDLCKTKLNIEITSRIKNDVTTIKNFLEKHRMIKPINREEFDIMRNAEIIGKADDNRELFDCPSWYSFIAGCELPFYLPKYKDNVTSFTLNILESRIKEIFP